MYRYIWDAETGGLLLTTEQSKFSKEPRPVYYKELDILGFDQYWNYPKDDHAPLMWAEANNYIYKGRTVAKTKGGSLYTAPELIILEEPEPNGGMLEFVDVDAMVNKNRELMETIAQETIQKIYNTYQEYKRKIDVFYVAFSGGKDSVVTLDLVQRALPHNDFLVLFGDTQMEFPDTYTIIKQVKQTCAKDGIQFFVAKSEQSPEYTWNEFGPPSQTMRWCCSVHKTSPQILLLRYITANSSFKGMAFTGIRGDESTSRNQYNAVCYGEKHTGQYSCHVILEWSSAEVFLYVFSNNLPLNETYKKGNSRAGCLVCPMATSKNFFFKQISYGDSEINDDLTTTKYNNVILNTTSKVFSTPRDEQIFMDTCGWKARRSGKELNFAENYCIENNENGILTITLLRERTDWKEWIKTLGDIIALDDKKIEVIFRKERYLIKREPIGCYQRFSVDVGSNTKNNIDFMSALKVVFRKSAYCIGCHVCEANCPYGLITMRAGKVKISNKCTKCRKCHKVFHGCLVANSLRLPKGVLKMGSIDRYSNMGVELDWILDYFLKKDEFWENHRLGKNKIKNLKSFLADAEITKKNKFTHFGEVIDKVGIHTVKAWALLLCNLVYTSEFNWWVMNTKVGQTYTQASIINMLDDNMTANSKSHIASAYKNIFISISMLGNEIGLGKCDYELKNGKRVLSNITRKHWEEPIAEVILYSLYKFAEACGEYYQFTLKTLLDDSIERDGVSPTRIFGLNRETMVRILNGLTINYPEFISASFTLDLDNITLRSDKTSEDVLKLF